MERLTKAALATGGAALLLLGGAGTLAYWTAEGTAEGPDIVSGSFSLSSSSCEDTWTLDDGTPLTGGSALVPGDTVTLECVYTIAGEGQHLALGDVTVSAPTWETENAFTAELTLTDPSFTVNGTEPALPAPIATGDTVEVLLGVNFDGPGATNASQSTTGAELIAALDTVTVTMTQAHAEAAG
ncbi:alternate-type signal peptide domain-containing protein [Myceligenerans salitolerans]|uniref:Alternate-type signal peptide domain-containing protein n=1 Tax=Myceligenerans salitolerans TaxID=1230528 RepID=A0ABS3I580_9MICO|nr:alternate-type signal peptide domain-containing protein [Myceligenerans salitolerans]MBO0607603.1 alternate-type signal peptide domain-containing protein [Myceligenerans salitolerans]